MLEIKNWNVRERNGRMLLRDICLTLTPGEILGLTGESGCGKTTLIKSIMGLLRQEQLYSEGQILLDGNPLTSLSPAAYTRLRGTMICLIPQTPMTAFDPSWRIGDQMRETFRYKLGMTKAKATEHAGACLRRVNLTDTERILRSFPGQLSGGMLQRIAVATVFGLQPTYILADEPTSALDEANSEIMTDLLLSCRESTGILLISHDAKALRRATDHLLVMHEGEIVNSGLTEEMFEHPEEKHTREFVSGAGEREGGWRWERL